MATLDINTNSVSVSDWPGPNPRIRQKFDVDVRKSLKASRYRIYLLIIQHPHHMNQ